MKKARNVAFIAGLGVLLALPARGQYALIALQTFSWGYPDSLAAANGALYGGFDGSTDCGSVFALQPPKSAGGMWTTMVLYTFNGADEGPCLPATKPVIAPSGAVYGITGEGGAYDRGTLYKLEPPSSPTGAWTESVLCSFGAECSYNQPGTGLIPGPGGSFYFAAIEGGAYGYGGLVQMAPPAAPGGDWTSAILYSFPSGALVNSLTMGADGVFYGTTYTGPNVGGRGEIFSLTPPPSPGESWTGAILYTFVRGDGSSPVSLTIGGDGALYGTTTPNQFVGGAAVVFQLTPPSVPGGSWAYKVLEDFGGNAGLLAPLVLHNGDLYGALTLPGGGEVFKLRRSVAGGSWTTSVLYGFDNGQSPMFALIVRPDGTIYGVTTDFSASPLSGMVYSLTPQ